MISQDRSRPAAAMPRASLGGPPSSLCTPSGIGHLLGGPYHIAQSDKSKRLRHGGDLIRSPRPARPCGSPLFSPDNKGKTLLRPGVACKIAAKNEESQWITRLSHGPAKAANRGEKRPEQRGQKRQQGSNRADKAVSEHNRTFLIYRRSRAAEYAANLAIFSSVGRLRIISAGHARPRAARTGPTPAATAARSARRRATRR
jgi:hypothetical protein